MIVVVATAAAGILLLAHPGSIFPGVGPVVRIDLGAVIADEVRTVHPGQQILVTAYENPSTGYGWEHQTSGGAAPAIQLIDSSYESAVLPAGMVGGGGTRTFLFGVEDGWKKGKDFSLEFVYARAWERNRDGPFGATHIIKCTLA